MGLCLLPSFRFFSFCWFVFSNDTVIGFALRHFISFCSILLLSLRNLFSSNERQRVDSEERSSREELGRVEGRETVIMIYYMGKELIF